MSDEAQAPSVWGTFQAHDARAEIAFLVALGFEATVVYGEGDRVDHAQLDWPEGGGVMMGSHKPGGEWVTEPGTAGFYVVTADPQAVHARAVAAGAQITREVNSTDYGSTEFGLRDPEGNQWSFGTYVGEPRKA
ncbi:MAG: VOC family protein [Marmoricola sp.]